MKKEAILGIFIILSIFISNFLISQEINDSVPHIDKNLSSTFEQIDNKFEENFIIPSGWENFFKIFFGIENSIPLSQTIILICLWIFFFILIEIFLENSDLFNNKIICWAISFIIVALMGVSKGILEGSRLLLIMFSFGFLAKWTILQIIFVLITILILFLLLKFFSDLFEKDRRLGTAEIRGAEAGAGIALARQRVKTS